ncbi:putative ALA-interacting subunit 2 isoform X3 [Arachis ipaensis]|uniref:putative ALA-interacting subunit 2 isoform X3 n=1 Tax=Arachis ipaensis TaxID=130454 RepID=UPI000A2B6411|nr:putative ALA-interacting subunit 2 isoform X3 [Arachis ipaensis]XP_020974592.1 putative ALA-interacting subunit 2 isoform X3 [Arachis ipaensis]
MVGGRRKKRGGATKVETRCQIWREEESGLRQRGRRKGRCREEGGGNCDGDGGEAVSMKKKIGEEDDVMKRKVPKSMRAPIYIYYQLDNYYQNHRRYVKSRNDKQLLHGLGDNSTSSCKPLESSGDLPIVPCGLIAWSVFNDTFKFSSGSSELKVNRKNIAWKSDRNHKFGKDVYPFNFQNGPLIGGGKLDPNTPLSDQEDLIVWMRTAALPSFRKLYGRIEEDLDADDVIVVQLMNNYNAYSFGGKKKLVLSTSSWLGGKNDFFGVASLFIGTFCMLISIVFLLLHVKNPSFQITSINKQQCAINVLIKTLWRRNVHILEQEKQFQLIRHTYSR